MSKKIFDRKLYLDGCRQLRVLGLVASLLFGLEAVLLPIYRMIERGDLHMINGVDSRYNADLFTLNPMAFLTFVVVVPMLTLTLFRFLNQRNSSDFYHSIPQTRICLGTSFLTSCMVWSLGILWGSGFLSLALHTLLPTGYHVLWKECLIQNLSLSILCFLVAAAIFLAMSITGNTFSNIIVTGLILFAPRLVMLVLKLGTGSSLSIISDDHYLGFLGNEWNMLTGIFYGIPFGTTSIEDLLVMPGAMIYTFLLAVIYLAMGMWRFHVRTSETAGQAAQNRSLQLVFRLTPAFLVSLLPTVTIYTMVSEAEISIGSDDLFLFFLLYLITVIIYFLYELISTRRVRNLKRAVPGLLLLAAMNLAVFFGMTGMRQSILSYTPEAGEIESVSFIGKDIDLYMGEANHYANTRVNGYLTSRRAAVKIADPEIRQIVSDRLKEGVEFEREGIIPVGSYDATVIIYEGHHKTYRKVSLTDSDRRVIARVLQENEEVRDIYMNLPDPEDENLKLFLRCDPFGEFTMKESREVFRALQEDVKEMGFEKWYTLASDMTYSGDVLHLGTLNMMYYEGTKVTGSALPITSDTPRAMGRCYQILYLHQQEMGQTDLVREGIDRYLTQSEEARRDSWSNLWAEAVVREADGTHSFRSLEISLEDPESVKALKELLEAQASINPSEESDGSDYMKLYVSIGFADEFVDRPVGASGEAYDTTYIDEQLIVFLPEGFDPCKVWNFDNSVG